MNVLRGAITAVLALNSLSAIKSSNEAILMHSKDANKASESVKKQLSKRVQQLQDGGEAVIEIRLSDDDYAAFRQQCIAFKTRNPRPEGESQGMPCGFVQSDFTEADSIPTENTGLRFFIDSYDLQNIAQALGIPVGMINTAGLLYLLNGNQLEVSVVDVAAGAEYGKPVNGVRRKTEKARMHVTSVKAIGTAITMDKLSMAQMVCQFAEKDKLYTNSQLIAMKKYGSTPEVDEARKNAIDLEVSRLQTQFQN